VSHPPGPGAPQHRRHCPLALLLLLLLLVVVVVVAPAAPGWLRFRYTRVRACMHV
jgi:hypothetical protein